MKEAFVIGGPNGAGKTTAAPELLPTRLRVIEFINADEIARGLSPFNAEGSAIAAGRVMIERIRSLIQARQSLAFETTCAGRAHIQTLRACKEAGYRLTLIYLWLPSPEAAIKRVARRVSMGGHHIPDDTVVRRYFNGLRNVRHVYLPMVDIGLVYDNADIGGGLIAERRPGASLVVHDAERWRLIEDATQ